MKTIALRAAGLTQRMMLKTGVTRTLSVPRDPAAESDPKPQPFAERDPVPRVSLQVRAMRGLWHMPYSSRNDIPVFGGWGRAVG